MTLTLDGVKQVIATGANTIQFNNSITAPATHSEGLVYWDANAGTLAVMTDVEDVIIQVGEEMQLKVFNGTASQIDNGEAVYITGVNGEGLPTIDLAQADSFATSLVAGLATEDIAVNSTGRVTAFGIVRDIDTSGLSAGQVFLSSTVAGDLTNTEPQPPGVSVQIGQVLIVGANDGQVFVDLDRAQNTPQSIVFVAPLKTLAANVFLSGELREQAANQGGDYATDFTVANNHMYLFINSITGTGDVTVTGASVDESDGVITAADTETITLDASTSQYYQTAKKWIEITNIDIPGSISAIDYNIGVVGYTDINNQNFEILSYRIDTLSDGANSQLRFVLYKIQDDGDKKMSVVVIEDYEVDSGVIGSQLIDYKRTGDNDRSYDPAVADVWPNGTIYVMKMGDFNTFFTNDENVLESASKDEGIIIQFQSVTKADHAVLQLRYRPF